MYRNKKIREAAEGEECTMHSEYCNHNPETTVAAHSPFGLDGKGLGIKSNDFNVAFLCSLCHDALDGRISAGWDREWREILFGRAHRKTLERLFELEIIK